MIGTIILIWALTLLSLFVGLIVGSRIPSETVEEIEKKLKKRFQKDDLPPGPITRPTQEQLEIRANPQAYEGVKETKKAFDELIKNDTISG